jgi:ferric iron reductase protein FhuF
VRQDVAGQRVVEVRAWELAWDQARETIAGETEAELVDLLVSELGPMIEVVNEISRRPRSALWRGAGDRLAQALVLAGEELGTPEDGEASARRALAIPGPLSGAVRFARVRAADGFEHIQLRNGCCLWHRIPGEGKCSNCPLLDADERAGRLLAEPQESG